MKRNQWKRRTTAGVVVLAIAMSACSSGSKSVSSSGFTDSLNTACRAAARSAGDLDVTDVSAYLKGAPAVLTTESDDLASLKAPKASKSDFDDFLANLDDQASQFKKVEKANKAGDAAGTTKDIAKLIKLVATNDSLADSLGASKCSGIFVADDLTKLGAAAATTTTEAATTTTAAPTTTIAPTVPPTTAVPVTAPATTVVPITMPPNSAPDMSVPASGDAASITGDLSQYQPPTGYSWDKTLSVPLSAVFASPSSDPLLGPSLVAYGVDGALPDGGGSGLIVIVIELSTKFTAPTIGAYLTFEGAGSATVITTPAGRTAAYAPATGGATFDTIVTFLQKQAVTIHVPTGGADPGSVIDAFVAANKG